MFDEDRRAASEVMGFILVFSLIVASVGIVFTVGVGGLQDVRDTERINNAERAFDVLAENYEKVVTGAPSRSTQIQLADASLAVGEPVQFEVNDSDGNAVNWEIGSITFAAGDERIRLVDGAVIRESPGGAVMVREPSWILDEDRAVFRDVSATTTGPTQVSGDRTVQVRIQQDGRPSAGSIEETSNITVNVTTNTPGPWENYYDDRGGDCDPSEPVGDGRHLVSCTFSEIEQFTFVEYDIDIAFE